MNKEHNHYIDLQEDDDFGFSFTNEDEITTPVYSSLNDEVLDLKKRLSAVEQIFLPLLENLARDPDKPMIRWPNRKEVIDRQIKKLKSLTNV
jgi:hypothetical protein